MGVLKYFLQLAAVLPSVMLVTSCNGIMGGIYDDVDMSGSADFGFIDACTQSKPGIVYIDATSYTDWVYIDFSTMHTVTLDVDSPAPASWDIAVHRYDAKTNGAKVAMSSASDFAEAHMAATSSFVADEWTTETIVTDMSTMMDGYLSYAESFYNAELSTWLDVDKSTMPPIYTLSGKVYIIALSDGNNIAVKLSDYMNADGVKGYMTIEYIYPFELTK